MDTQLVCSCLVTGLMPTRKGGSRPHRRCGLAPLMILAGALVSSCNPYDISAPDDSDLSPVTIPDEDNASPLLRKAVDAVQLSDRDHDSTRAMLDAHTWDADLASKVLDENQEALGYLGQALERPALGPAEWPDSTEEGAAGVETLDRVRKLEDLLLLRAISSVQAARSASPPDDLFAALRLAQLLEGDTGQMYLLSKEMRLRALDQVDFVFEYVPVNGASVRATVAQLELYRIDRASITRLVQGEWRALKEALRQEWSEHLGSETERYYLHPNRTDLLFLRAYRIGIDNTDRPCNQQLNVRHFDLRGLGGVMNVFTPNSTGKIAYEIADVGGVTQTYQRIRCDVNDTLSVAEILLALRAYRNENAQLPETLGALVPTYFDAIPKSEQDGEPFLYSAQERTLAFTRGWIDENGTDSLRRSFSLDF
jgi:hypothetical protein